MEKDGLIDRAKVLHFDVDDYYSHILAKKGEKLSQDQARVEEFKARASERRQQQLLPFERANRKAASKVYEMIELADKNSESVIN